MDKFTLKKLVVPNMTGGAKLKSPPHNYCLIVYENLTPQDIAKSNITDFYIKYGRISPKKTEVFSNITRETIVFDSPSYPDYLFMMVYDYNTTTYGNISSLYYRLKPYELGPIEYITEPNKIFNAGISGCLAQSNTTSYTAPGYYNVGDRVLISNKLVKILNSNTDKFIVHQYGTIMEVLANGFYNILFDDYTKGINIYGNDIDLIQQADYSLNKSSLANLALLNNLNSNINKQSFSDIQDVGNNPKLQEQITKFYIKKTIKWLNKDKEFTKFAKQSKFIESQDGKKFIYKILKSFVKKNKVNWYDLRNDETYEDIKDYIREKISHL